MPVFSSKLVFLLLFCFLCCQIIGTEGTGRLKALQSYDDNLPNDNVSKDLGSFKMDKQYYFVGNCCLAVQKCHGNNCVWNYYACNQTIGYKMLLITDIFDNQENKCLKPVAPFLGCDKQSIYYYYDQSHRTCFKDSSCYENIGFETMSDCINNCCNQKEKTLETLIKTGSRGCAAPVISNLEVCENGVDYYYFDKKANDCLMSQYCRFPVGFPSYQSCMYTCAGTVDQATVVTEGIRSEDTDRAIQPGGSSLVVHYCCLLLKVCEKENCQFHHFGCNLSRQSKYSLTKALMKSEYYLCRTKPAEVIACNPQVSYYYYKKDKGICVASKICYGEPPGFTDFETCMHYCGL